jgi:hypothetical protein
VCPSSVSDCGEPDADDQAGDGQPHQ